MPHTRRGGPSTTVPAPDRPRPFGDNAVHIIKWLLTLIRGSAVPRPTDRFTWERIIERAELPSAAKLVALLMATFANENGSRVRPGQGRVAAACDWTPQHIAQQIKILRDAGLLLQVRPAAGPRRPPLYQLSLPDDAPVPMRLDEGGYRIEPKKRGRGGRKTKGETGVSEINNSSSGIDPEGSNPSSLPGELQFSAEPAETEAAELELAEPQTPVSEDPNCSLPNQPRPTKTNPVPGSYLTPTSAEPGSDEATNQHDVDSTDPKIAYRSAERVLAAVSRSAADHAITEARAQLAPEGITGARQITIRAAQILTAYAEDAARRGRDERGPR